MLPLALLFACQDPSPDAQITRPFPAGFAWGAATAGFQVDMGCPTWDAATCDDPASDWYQWVTDPSILAEESLFVTGEPVSHGPGMWELFEDDVARMQADGLNTFRMSVEWSRLFPASTEDVTTVEGLDARANPAAVARYHEMFAALKDAGIEPYVTVNHYVLPLWVHDGVACHNDPESCEASGWLNGERILPLITTYAGWVGREFGGDVDRWATLNEPFATTAAGYLQPGEDRSAPPGLVLNGPGTVASLENQVLASAQMYDALKANDTTDADGDGVVADVGVVINMIDIVPKDPNKPEDVASAAKADHLYHRLFLDGLATGQWDDDRDGTFDRTRDDLAGRLDWIGVNYYNQVTVQYLGGFQPLGDLVPAFDFYPTFSWDPHPEGLGNVTRIAASYGLPVVITENGTPDTAGSKDILDGHLASLWSAIDEGANVRGYLYWSWVDNYEWNHGLDLKFGLYELNIDTKERTARPVMERYREVVANGGLE